MSATTSSQREAILNWLLNVGSITTQEARENLEITSPAPRIFELKALGWRIETKMVEWRSHRGISHRIAKYILTGKKGSE